MKDSSAGYLSADRFLDLVGKAPLISIDLILVNTKSEMLLGKRKNEPAKGSWFVPGGRIRKGERLSDALCRIVHDEIGDDVATDQARFLGVFEHFYETNFAFATGVSTHYVVLAYMINGSGEEIPTSLAQHDEFRWAHLGKMSQDLSIHPYSREYGRCLSELAKSEGAFN